MYNMYLNGACPPQKRDLDTLELDLNAIVIHHVNRQYFKPQSHLSRSYYETL